jgi:predicted ester cyclase
MDPMTYAQHWRDFPDYILGITKEIWEDRGIATLHRYYAPEIIVRTPAALTIGNRGVIAATMATMAEFPDRTLLGEDVIWCEGPGGGHLSSHRIVSTATHLGDGVWGPATGRRLVYRIVADCHASGEVIDDEWLIRDQGAITRQLGIHPRDFAAAQIARDGGTAGAHPFTPAADRPGPYRGRGNDNPWGARYAAGLGRIMAADLAAIPAIYDRAASLFLPGGVQALGPSEADRFWLGLRAAFPDAEFAIHHVIGRDDPLMPPRAAIRWSLTGRHTGPGPFGPPSGAEVHVMAISHAEFGPWSGPDGRGGPGIRREWVLFDETAIWTQILLNKRPA